MIKSKIINKAQVEQEKIVKIDNIINHNIDIKLLDEIAKDIYDNFKEQPVDKIVTVEASGIALAIMVARYFNDVDVVYAKKEASLIQHGDLYETKVTSYTKNKTYDLTINKKYITSDDHVLVVDDFLATGEAINGLERIINQAGATILGAAFIINKTFQNDLDKKDYKIYSVLEIESLKDNHIVLKK